MGNEFVEISSVILGSMHLIILATKNISQNISSKFLLLEIKTSKIKTGIANMIGNKGGLCIAFTYENLKFLILNSHLAAGQNKNKARNNDFHRINYELEIEDYPKKSENETITDQFDFCIWMGDLNYRINLEQNMVQYFLLNKSIDHILAYDQFYQEIENKKLDINHFYEHRINFYPTYKFLVGTDDYDMQDDKIPGWTDRILLKYNSKVEDIVSVTKYNWIKSIKCSDHKPVCLEMNILVSKLDFKEKENLIINDNKTNNKSETKACSIF